VTGLGLSADLYSRRPTKTIIHNQCVKVVGIQRIKSGGRFLVRLRRVTQATEDVLEKFACGLVVVQDEDLGRVLGFICNDLHTRRDR